MAITWGEILADPTMNRVAKRLNKKWLWISEEDILFMFNQFEDMQEIMKSKKSVKKKGGRDGL